MSGGFSFKETTMAPRTPAETTETQAPDVVRTKRVIIQRPPGDKDVGCYLGFNEVSGVYPYGVPIELPADMVEYYRSQQMAQAFPDENGTPVITYVNMFNIVDAPAPAAFAG